MSATAPGDFDLLTATSAARRTWALRRLKDRTFGALVGVGGVAVVGALLLIFFYLVSVVLPIFAPARLEDPQELALPREIAPRILTIDEYGEVGLSLAADGRYALFRVSGGALLEQGELLAAGTAVAHGDPAQRVLGAANGDGLARIARVEYRVSYPGDRRLVTPELSFPFGTDPLRIAPPGVAIASLSLQANDDEATLVAVRADGVVSLTHLLREENLLTGESSVTQRDFVLPFAARQVALLRIDVDQRELYLLDTDQVLHLYDIQRKDAAVSIDAVDVGIEGGRVTAMDMLSGGISVLLGYDNGRIAQWFPVRDDANRYGLALVRVFDALDSPVAVLLPEYFRKGFVAIGTSGMIGVYHATAHRTLLQAAAGVAPAAAAIGPRADRLLLAGDGAARAFGIDNEHPEVSWRSLWGKVWYESRQGPEYIWQSSSASNDFEPKFSLTPLTFGTIKAAIYAMGFAVPLAIFGAMYTAYFMSARMRALVKPAIEVMAALPTVILGFLAGLWFAPLVERHLPGVFLLLLLLPLSCIAASLLWTRLPQRFTRAVPPGWEAALLLPVVCLVGWACMAGSQGMELLLFGGDMPRWITEHLGLGFDQRNSLVVGVSVGIAVIPSIFSISEDAIYEVPRHLTMGSLALGATPWQTMVRVVLLTASPGIFSAVMIGLGRAVGETMIVLMATGNTPIMDLNIFQGFRALSANIAVEMPESEVGSTHYRILFLAALVLFLVTFLFNTVAEIVRQRLRVRYSNL